MPKGVYVHSSELQLACLTLGRKGRAKGARNVKKTKPKNWKRQEASRQRREDKRVDQRSDERIGAMLIENNLEGVVEQRAQVIAQEISSIGGAQLQVAA